MPRKAVRAPFVVTVAVVASASIACGGRFEPTPGEPGDSGGDTPLEDAPTCPNDAPAIGSACSVPGTSCSYGSYCSGKSVVCEAGIWVDRTETCNPPPPICPKDEPVAGTRCPTGMGVGWGTCSYADKCPLRPSTSGGYRHYRCSAQVSGVWQRVDTPYKVACPSSPPNDGDPCPCAENLPDSCNYGDCGGEPTRVARCDAATKTWSVAVTSCNPPPPPDGDGGSPSP